MELRDITFAIEGILFAAGEPVPKARLAELLEIEAEAVEGAIEELEAHYNEGARGIRLLRIEDGVQFCSAPEYAEVVVRVLEKRRVPQLSPSALEVLSIIAYFQPVTRAYIEKVRGVESSYTVSLLANRGLIERCGQLQVPGRPGLYQTTNAFLRSFGLQSLAELPPLPEIEDEGDAQAQIKEAIAAIQREQVAAEQAAELAEEIKDTLFAIDAEPEEVVAELSEEDETEAETEAGVAGEVESEV